MTFSPQDRLWMERALKLAEQGRGYVEPNPLVGAVLVRDGRVIGEGYHQKFGESHAEINALAQAGDEARGATLYVTLEPCSHHGKTPPCTDALIRAGIARVVAAMLDPFPQVSGKGEAALRAAGIAVEVGLCEPESSRLNAPYLKLLSTGKPYVHAKWAMTLDGKIATRTGDSRWISGEASRQRVHELRGRVDAIVVGGGTVLADNPLLTARPAGPRTACRVILDNRGQIPWGYQVLTATGAFPTLIVSGAAAEIQNSLRLAGCEVLESNGKRWEIEDLLQEMGRRRWTNVLVEGGSAVLGAFFDAGAVDEVHVYLAPCLVGGSQALSPLGGIGLEKIAEASRLKDFKVEKIGDDIYLHGFLGSV